MNYDDEPMPAVYRLQILYNVDDGSGPVGPEHELPENLIFVTTSPPSIPRIGETYSPHNDPADDAPSGWISIPWTVEDVDHTVWPEQNRIVFETKIYLVRNNEHVTAVAKENEARHPE